MKCRLNTIGETNTDEESYRQLVGEFAIDWRALQGVRCNGNPSCWCIGICPFGVVHGWITQFFLFSTITTARQNVDFKMGMHHLFLGYAMSRPYPSARAFTYKLEPDALALGLQRWHAWHDTKDKNRRI